MKNKNQMPWLTPDGVEMPTEKLKKISHGWDLQTWEQYLNWYQSADRKVVEESDSKNMPWLGRDRRLLEEGVLKEVSKSWENETWERFLIATVEYALSRNETCLWNYEAIVDETSESIWSEHGDVPLEVSRKLRWAVHQLTALQRKIIYGIFYHGQAEAEVARNLGISRQTASEAKQNSLKKIKALLDSDPDIATYLIGGSTNLDQPQRSRDEEVCEVYRQDLKGSYIK